MQLLRSLFPNKILEMSGNSRRWIKSTPSPVVLREQVYRNCLSEVKSKRNGLVQQLRQGSPAIRNELLKSFVSEVYSATKLENSYIGESTHEMDYDGVDLDDLELLKQIADAIEYELETQRNNEIRLLELAEQEEFAAVSMYEEDINSIICPLCRCVLKNLASGSHLIDSYLYLLI